MLRNLSATKGEQGFNWRASEITRLEAFSDAVFAFAVTLLVVSLEVPHTFRDLLNVMKGFPAFAICFAMLAQVWYQHSKFFRRYGLQDTYTIFLNSVLLFVVLFYVYPLKFLFTLLLGQMSRGALMPENASDSLIMSGVGDTRALMVIYGLGFAAVFGLFGFLYLYAYKQRTALDLNALEIHRTCQSLIDNCGMATFGLVSAGAAVLLPERWLGLAGYIYFGIGLYELIAGTIFGRRERKIQQRMAAAATSLS